MSNKDNPLLGMAEGFGAGFGLSYVPWNAVGAGLGNAGSWIGMQAGSVFQNSSWYLNLMSGALEWGKYARKKDYEFISKQDLYFDFSSYIDRSSWYADQGTPKLIGLDPTGEKLFSNIHLDFSQKGNKLSKLNLSMSSEIMTNDLGFKGVKIKGLPDVEIGAGAFDLEKANFFFARIEKHAKVNAFEEFGLFMNGKVAVNVAQSLKLFGLNNKISIEAATDIFPSARLYVNNRKLFQYNQPKFSSTHKLTSTPKYSLYRRY